MGLFEDLTGACVYTSFMRAVHKDQFPAADIAFDGSDEDGMAIDEDMLASMTDEEIEEYFNKLYGEEENAENADGENADAADADAAFAE